MRRTAPAEKGTPPDNLGPSRDSAWAELAPLIGPRPLLGA